MCPRPLRAHPQPPRRAGDARRCRAASGAERGRRDAAREAPGGRAGRVPAWGRGPGLGAWSRAWGAWSRAWGRGPGLGRVVPAWGAWSPRLGRDARSCHLGGPAGALPPSLPPAGLDVVRRPPRAAYLYRRPHRPILGSAGPCGPPPAARQPRALRTPERPDSHRAAWPCGAGGASTP